MSGEFLTVKYETVEDQAPKPPERPIKLKVTVIGDGLNYHFERTIDANNEKTFQFKSENYTIDEKAFYLPDMGIFRRIGRKLARRKPFYHILYKMGGSIPLFMDYDADPENPEPTAKMIQTARLSKALKRGLDELFKTPISGKLFLFILLIIGVGAIAYFIMTGALNIEGLV